MTKLNASTTSEKTSLFNWDIIESWSNMGPRLRSILRIVVGFLFMQVGTAKLFAFPAAIMPNGGTPPLDSLIGVAGILETFGGLLLLLGLFTRPVAFLLAGEMAFAYFYAHAPQGFWPVLNQGAPAIFYCFLYLYFSAVGGGPWSLDAWWQNKLNRTK